ncbi:MAG: hypothetical protein HKL80_11295 [Acidimicrobiales bacterium]|nr:hypothetical protein [Acidimicrobiales bacterium]
MKDNNLKSFRLSQDFSLVRVLIVLLIIAGVTGIAWTGVIAYNRITAPKNISCSWPLQVQGNPVDGQVGLVKCYLKALAQGNKQEMIAVADNCGITTSDFAYSKDAHYGTATGNFVQGSVTPLTAKVSIRFANGTEEVVLLDVARTSDGQPVEPLAWRMSIGPPNC